MPEQPEKKPDSRSQPAEPIVKIDQQLATIKIKQLEDRLKAVSTENEMFRRKFREVERQYKSDVHAALITMLQDMTGWSDDEARRATDGLNIEQLEGMIQHYGKIQIATKPGTPQRPYRSIKAAASVGVDSRFTVPDVYGKTKADIAKMASEL